MFKKDRNPTCNVAEIPPVIKIEQRPTPFTNGALFVFADRGAHDDRKVDIRRYYGPHKEGARHRELGAHPLATRP